MSLRVQGQGEESVGLGIMRSLGPQSGIMVRVTLLDAILEYLFIHFELWLHVVQAGLKLIK